VETFIPLAIWLGITVVFVILEFMADFYFLPVAIGAGVAAVSSLVAIPLVGQIIAFAIVTVLAYVLFRPDKQRGRKGAPSGRHTKDDPIDFD